MRLGEANTSGRLTPRPDHRDHLAAPHRHYQHAPCKPSRPRLASPLGSTYVVKTRRRRKGRVNLAANRSRQTGVGVISTGPRAGASRSPQAGQAVHRALEEDRGGGDSPASPARKHRRRLEEAGRCRPELPMPGWQPPLRCFSLPHTSTEWNSFGILELGRAVQCRPEGGSALFDCCVVPLPPQKHADWTFPNAVLRRRT